MNKTRLSVLCLVGSLIVPFAGSMANADVIYVDGVVRDFMDSHPDMESTITGLDFGIVEGTLGTDGTPVYAGVAGNPSTHGEDAFYQWYHDVDSVNMRTDTVLMMSKTITADERVYTHRSPNYFPIDDQLFGNQGNDHNFHFTYELHTEGLYRGGEVLKFGANDDMWRDITESCG